MSSSEAPTGPRTDNGFAVGAPQLALPKSGGAIRGIGETFAANPVLGTGTMSVPIAASPGRSNLTPQLALSYDSGSGHGVFGLGWSLALPSITRKTDKGLPRYDDAAASDVFILSGAEDLVPVDRDEAPRHVGGACYRVSRFRPRIEGLFARIECWRNTADPGDVFWRSISRENITSWYGRTPESRVADPSDRTRIFAWLICESHDDKGNAMVYGYKPEDSANVDDASTEERNRSAASRSVNRYPKRIRYGNRTPYWEHLEAGAPWPLPPGADAVDAAANWLFELVFDYGEHDDARPLPSREARAWPVRHDPFSSWRSTFEMRTYRRCARVLMFHHFPDEAGVGADCLVRSTDLLHSDALRDPLDPVYSLLKAVRRTSYRRVGEGYESRSLPPVEFDYSEAMLDDRVHCIDASELENAPSGLADPRYRWVDLNGDGSAGLLTEQGGAWHYKPNWSAANQRDDGDGPRTWPCFGPMQLVPSRPSLAALAGGRQQLVSLSADGRLDLVQYDGNAPGYFERTEDGKWQPFMPFDALPHIDWHSPDLRFIDLTGDGLPDLMIGDRGAFWWHESFGKNGFGPARPAPQSLDEERGPRLMFSDAAESIFLADMSGDGLTDLVRVRNGEVCYWPNRGYGRFGAKVTMRGSPWLDRPEQFDGRRIRLADIDGSGTADLIYLGASATCVFFNLSGNAWSAARTLESSWPADTLASATAVDLLGNGTACLVWSSVAPGLAARPMRYLKLIGENKPNLLIRTRNNLGAETRLRYAPSTKFFVADQRAGRQWITRLPFPVHVVERVETIDAVSRNRLASVYAYHHGYYDGVEREFRGFGMVEQWDTEHFDALADGDSARYTNIGVAGYVPPVLTKTWFHTGVYLGREHVSDYFAGLLDASDRGEYFREPGASDATARDQLLTDTTLPRGLDYDEEREACRALKGSMLRQEVYALDGSDKEPIPYATTERNYRVEVLQRIGTNLHGVFLAMPHEVISAHYERDATDPRVHHTLTLETDEFGSVLKEAAIGYGRRAVTHSEFTASDRARQTTDQLVYTESRMTQRIDSADAHRTPQHCETRSFELTDYQPSGPARRYVAADFVEPDLTAPGRLRHRYATEVAYEATAIGARCRRGIEWLRTLFRSDDLTRLLPIGELPARGLPGESYKLSFTPGLLTEVFQRDGRPLLPDPAQVLGGVGDDRGGYLQSQALKEDGRFPASDPDDHWWIRSGRTFYATAPQHDELEQARRHFFQPRRYRNAFDHDTTVDFDAHDLLVVETCDALGNRVTVEANDYRVLQALRISDPNRNRTEVSLDTLGLVVGTAVMGKASTVPAQGDTLAQFVADLTAAQHEAFFGAPDPREIAPSLLQGATTRILYDLDRFQRTQRAHPDDPARWQPACAAVLTRETHVSELAPGQRSRLQLGFSYSDGFGREIQKKISAAAAQWIATSWVIFNNKGNPVRKYEPFFSATHRFEFGIQVGVSPVLIYDPMERVIATLHPNHSFEKTIFHPWQQTIFDLNDTCSPRGTQTGDPRTDADIGGFAVGYFGTPEKASWQTWYQQRIGGDLGPDERTAALRSAVHANTPTTQHLDALGRPFLTVARNRTAADDQAIEHAQSRLPTRIELDIEGNQRAVRDANEQAGDPLGRVVMRYDQDMLGNRLRQISMDAGTRWMLNDAGGKPIRAWDSRGHETTTRYDALRRVVENRVNGAVVERIEYGDRLAQAEALNLRTRVCRHFDSAGVMVNGRLSASGEIVESFDFKGNLLHGTRRLMRDYTTTPDWQRAPALEAETFESSTRYDALNRAVQSTAPHSDAPRAKRHVIQPAFDAANRLARVDVWMDRGADPAGLLDPREDAPSAVGVSDIEYDAKGQRLRIDYKNGATTRYEYDPQTFRLTRLSTLREGAERLQDLDYTYDPSGNVTHLEDAAQQTLFFRNQCIKPSSDYVYDALYRLVQATGREHLGQGRGSAEAFGANIGLEQPGNGQAMSRYVEHYRYDAVGNLLEMRHRGSDAAHAGWTRAYQYEAPSPIEGGGNATLRKSSNRLTCTALNPNAADPQHEAYAHDEHGNMVRMPHLGLGRPGPNMHWDYRDCLQKIDLGGGGVAFYVYDGSGERVRKVWEKAPGLTEERIYLNGFEIFRSHRGAIGTDPVTLERETLHVMDDKQRVAIVETRSFDAAGGDPAPARLIRYQFANHIGSSVVESDDHARIISYEEYAPFGGTTYQAVRGQTETAKRYRYTGKERDEESGLYYHGARYYAAWIGRWTACDSSFKESATDLYVYVNDNPICFNDPTGRDAAAAGLVLRWGVERAVAAEVIGLGPEDPVADVVAGVILVGALAYAGVVLFKGPVPRPKEDPKPETKPETKPEPKIEPKPKPEPKPEPKLEPKPQPKPQPKPDLKPQPKPLPKPGPKLGPDIIPDLPDPKDPRKMGRIYVTYTAMNEQTGLVYSGRTDAPVDLTKPLQPQAEAALAGRYVNDDDEYDDPTGWSTAVLDTYDVGYAVNRSNRYMDRAYYQMRGREQQLIDHYGGAWSDTGTPYKTGNEIRAVAKDNVFGKAFHDAATLKWGEMHPYTGR